MIFQHTLTPLPGGAGQSGENITFIHTSKVAEQDGPTDPHLRLIDVCQVVVARSLGFRPGKGGRSEGDSFNFPSSLPIFNNILANEDCPLIPPLFRRGFLVSSSSHFFKAASLRQWLVTDLLAWKCNIDTSRLAGVRKVIWLSYVVSCCHRAIPVGAPPNSTLHHRSKPA